MAGFLNAEPRTPVEVVHEAVGRFSHPDGWVDQKSRLWIFADKTVAVYVNGPTTPIRHEFEVRAVVRRGKGLEIILADGRLADMIVANCACGFGAVAYAGPIDTRFAIKWSRDQEWFIQR